MKKEYETVIKNTIDKCIDEMIDPKEENCFKLKEHSRIDKFNYLNKYLKSKEKYEFLNNSIQGVHSIDFNYVKSSVHKSLINRIYERDIAFWDMVENYIELDKTLSKCPIKHKGILYDVFVNGYSFNEIENRHRIKKSEIKKMIDYCIDNLHIKE